MSISVACPGCGKRYRMKDAKAGRTVPCKACGATLEVPAGGGVVFEQSTAKTGVNRAPTRPRQDRPVPIDAIIRGTGLLLVRFLVATAAFFGWAFVRMQLFDVEGWAPVVLGWLPLVSAIVALVAGVVWFRVASDLECREPAAAAVILQAVLVGVTLLSRFARIDWLNQLASLGGWVFYILIVAVLREAALRIERADQLDSATFVVQMGVGVGVQHGRRGSFPCWLTGGGRARVAVACLIAGSSATAVVGAASNRRRGVSRSQLIGAVGPEFDLKYLKPAIPSRYPFRFSSSMPTALPAGGAIRYTNPGQSSRRGPAYAAVVCRAARCWC